MKYQSKAAEEANNRAVVASAIKCLLASPFRVLRRVTCSCRDGVLTLKGRLFSFHEKQVAQETVSHVEGMNLVNNEIEVD
jgi:hypothetical protein